MKRHHDPLPTEFISAATLQMRDSVGISIDTGEQRFPTKVVGSHFSNTMIMPSSFRIEKFHKIKPPMLDQS